MVCFELPHPSPHLRCCSVRIFHWVGAPPGRIELGQQGVWAVFQREIADAFWPVLRTFLPRNSCAPMWFIEDLGSEKWKYTASVEWRAARNPNMTSLSVHLQHFASSEGGRLSDEEAFLRALLDATIYAHVPLEPAPPGRIRFVQFDRPDNGQTVLPLFTDEPKARFAAQGHVQIIAMPGREMLKLTQGATLMLNPNDERYVLYPEEVGALLSGRPLGGLSNERGEKEEQAKVGPPTVPVEALVSALAPLHASDPNVHASVVMEMHRGPNWNDRSLLLIIVTPSAEAERLIRASAVAAQPALSSLALPLLIKHLGPDEPLPSLWDQSTVIQTPRRPDDSGTEVH